MASADLLLHPVRLRILQTMLGTAELTTAQLCARMPDIPPATMYRHVAALSQAEILEVVRETPVRGTVERAYRVRQSEALVSGDDRATMTKKDHRKAFTVFAGALLADFDRYLERDDTEPARDGVLYRQGVVWATESEFAELVDELEAVVERHTALGQGRTRHVVSLVLVPDKGAHEPGQPDGDPDS